MRSALLFLAIVALFALADPVQAAEAAGAAAGFWSGFVDGLLSLFKLLLSPFLDVAIVGDVGTWSYTAGYYLGVLVFVGAAGAAASGEASEPREVRLASVQPRH